MTVKKTICASLMIFLLWMSAFSQGRFRISLGGNYFRPSDEVYKTVYGKSKFYPEIQGAVRISRNFYIEAGYGFLSATGTIPESHDHLESRMKFLSVFIGYMAPLIGKFNVLIELGREYVHYTEKAWGETKSDSSLGFQIRGGCVCPILKNFFAVLFFGYSNTSDTLDQEFIKLGGLKAGLSLGTRF